MQLVQVFPCWDKTGNSGAGEPGAWGNTPTNKGVPYGPSRVVIHLSGVPHPPRHLGWKRKQKCCWKPQGKPCLDEKQNKNEKESTQSSPHHSSPRGGPRGGRDRTGFRMWPKSSICRSRKAATSGEMSICHQISRNESSTPTVPVAYSTQCLC